MMTAVDSCSGITANGDAAPIFSDVASTYVSAARRDNARFIGGLLGVAGGESRRRMDTRHPHEEGVGRDLLDRLHGDRAARHDRVLEEPAADQEDLDRWVGDELHAIVGLCVITVAARSSGRWRASCWAVVPPSMMTV